jgi:2-dehydro-3-deoxyphosphogluconate aldolase/(4S)-4-hydroxy-2-oxoglutarate aldolase
MTIRYDSGIIAVIRTDNPKYALTLGRAFSDTSISAIEVTMTVPTALDVVKTLINERIERVGLGTVRTVDQVKEAAEIGATFVVSPHSDEALIKEAARLGLAVTPGAFTPSEVVRAVQWGATSVKLFPINALGGISFVESILEPLPDMPLVVSGGVQPEEVQSYLKLGVKGVCMGGALWTPEIVATGDIARVRDYALQALERM